MNKYFVANDNGDVAGHDLDLDHAEQVLDAMLTEDAENAAGWEIINGEDETGENREAEEIASILRESD